MNSLQGDEEWFKGVCEELVGRIDEMNVEAEVNVM